VETTPDRFRVEKRKKEGEGGMTHNLDLMRIILLKIEEEYPTGENWIDVQIDGYSQQDVASQCDLLFKKGLIKGYRKVPPSLAFHNFSIQGLTVLGSEFTKAIRNKSDWENAIKEIEKKDLPKTIENIAESLGYL